MYKSSGFLKTVKWTARVLSILFIGFVLMFWIGEGGGNPFRLGLRVLIHHLFFPLGVMAGMIIAWKREGLGGLITVVSVIIFYILNFASCGRFPKGPWFAIISSPGLLFIFYWLLNKKSARSEA
ncbi:MAG: hypothetical protein JW983_09310 [Elusimicrobia bacterium]|nr:hypothetical protein [Elusimicrobiota bacterium]